MILMRAAKLSVSLLILATILAPCLACKKQAANSEEAQSNAQAASDSSSNHAPSANEQQRARAQIFHGNIGERTITMQIARAGQNFSGTYYYDSIGKNLVLKGSIDGSGNVTLQEFDESGKQTGKFKGKFGPDEFDDFVNSFSGVWTTPTGGNELSFSLTEQDNEFSGGVHIETKLISVRRRNVRAAYPQLAGGSNSSINAFNQRIAAIVMKEVRAFSSEPPSPDDNRSYFDANYTVLLGTDDIVSVEINEDFYGGGAHPDITYQTLTYDMHAGREIQLASLFKPGANYKKTLQQKSLDSINRRIKQAEQQDAQAGQQQESVSLSPDELGDISGWAMTPKGLIVYYDLPHVIAAFDRAFIPYSELSDMLDPNGPAAKFARSGR